MWVRTASERDVGAISSLLGLTWHATYDRILGIDKVEELTRAWHAPDRLIANLARPRSECVVADDGSAIFGVAYAIADAQMKTVGLTQLYVHPDRQRGGIGTDLLAEIVDAYPDIRVLHAEVERRNEGAIIFYRKRGFEMLAGGEGGGDPAIDTVTMERTFAQA